MLFRGLPDNAVSKRDSPDDAPWGLTEELTAQLIEEVSVLAADRRRKEPRSVPRPWEKKDAKPKPLDVSEDGAVHAHGYQGMLAAAQMRGAVSLG